VSDRPSPLLLAAVLLLVIGLSGLGAGLTIVGAMTNGPVVPIVGMQIGLGIAGYGVLATVASIGLLGRRRAFWWLAVATIGAGLVLLVGLIGLIGLASIDPVFATGIVIWGIALACLLAPATRAALRR
jgi:hypothetical protein